MEGTKVLLKKPFTQNLILTSHELQVKPLVLVTLVTSRTVNETFQIGNTQVCQYHLIEIYECSTCKCGSMYLHKCK